MMCRKGMFKPGMNEWVGDGKLIIISMTVGSISLRSVVAVRQSSQYQMGLYWCS